MGWDGCGSKTGKEETVRAERSRGTEAGLAGAQWGIPTFSQVSLWPWFCSRTLFFVLYAPYLLLEK